MSARKPEPWETSAAASFLQLEPARGTVEVWTLGADRFSVAVPEGEQLVVGFDVARHAAHELARELE